MARLAHSFDGFVRKMQISSRQLFVLVEGVKSDPYFYGQICRSVVKGSQVSYEVCVAEELGTGGKQVLLQFFDYLRHKDKLRYEFMGARKAVLFFLDKDIDDFLRSTVCSPHVVYTRFYDVANHIFEHGDLAKAAAAATSLDPQVLSGSLSCASGWCQEAARRWKDWVQICFFSQVNQVGCEYCYASPSKIKTGADKKAIIRALRRVAKNKGVRFRERFQAARRRVDQLYKRGEHHRVFKGKWFTRLLSDDIRRCAAALRYDKNALGDGLLGHVVATLDFDAPWADHFRTPIARLKGFILGKRRRDGFRGRLPIS